jgi:hypothetical protein
MKILNLNAKNIQILQNARYQLIMNVQETINLRSGKFKAFLNQTVPK